MKIRLTTTLELLKKHKPCEGGYKTLVDYLGHDYPEDKDINLLTILESNGEPHCMWALRATNEDCSQVARLIAADCAESILHIYQRKCPDDDRPAKAIQASRDYANGLIDDKALETARADAAAAAYDAARAADADYAAADAAAAAYAAAVRAVYSTPHAAAAAADYAAGRKKEEEKQTEIIRKYLIQ